MRVFWVLIIAGFLLTACDTGQSEPQTIQQVAVANRPLATVYISPTPNVEQMQATRLASSPTPTPQTPTPTPQPTAYIGVFIGEAEPLQSGIVDPEIFASISTPLAPTVEPTTCTIEIDGAYVSVWRSESLINQRMGCPIQQGIGFFGLVQVFENGVMYQHSDTNEVWTIVPDVRSGEYIYDDQVPDVSTAGIGAPDGLIVPSGTLGSVWMSQPGLRDILGFAQTPPIRVSLGYQRFSGGTFLLDSTSGQTFALLADGTAYGPFIAGLTGTSGIDGEEATAEVTPEVEPSGP